MRQILDKPNSTWWDNQETPDRVENRNEVFGAAMRAARDELTSQQSRNPDQWEWGTGHKLNLVNATLGESGIGVIESLFNRGPYEVAGGGGIVNANSWDAREGFGVTAAPSMRMVIDLDDFDKSRWIQLTGNSGHAFHANYTDQAELWAEGKTLPWAFTKKGIDRRVGDEMTLVPATSG